MFQRNTQHDYRRFREYFAYHNVFQTNESDGLLINKDKNTEKALAAFHSYGKPEWPILIQFSQDRAENREVMRFSITQKVGSCRKILGLFMAKRNMRHEREREIRKIMTPKPRKGSHLPLFHTENELKLKNNKLKQRK